MRNNELTEGIEVMDHNHNVVGTSKIAAKKVCYFKLFCFWRQSKTIVITLVGHYNCA